MGGLVDSECAKNKENIQYKKMSRSITMNQITSEAVFDMYRGQLVLRVITQ